MTVALRESPVLWKAPCFSPVVTSQLMMQCQLQWRGEMCVLRGNQRVQRGIASQAGAEQVARLMFKSAHKPSAKEKSASDSLLLEMPGGFPAVIKNLPANAGDVSLSPGWERSPGRGNGNPLQYSCFENLMGGEVWWDTAHGVAKI